MVERAHRGADERRVGRLAAAAQLAREQADALHVVEQPLPLLLDEDDPEHVAEQADVAPELRVGPIRHPRARLPVPAGRRCGR